MKTPIIFLSVVVSSLCISSISAVWWNPKTWGKHADDVHYETKEKITKKTTEDGTEVKKTKKYKTEVY